MLNQMNRSSAGWLWMLLMVAATVPAGAGEPIAIRPRWTAGDARYFEISESAVQTLAAPQATMKTAVDQVVGFREIVDEVTAEKIALTWVFERMALGLNSPTMGPKMEYDTDVPNLERTGKLVGPICRNFVGATLKLELDGQGKVTSFTGMKEAVDKVGKNTLGNMIFSQLREGMTDDLTRNEYVDSRMVLYPDRPVKEGDAWKAEVRRNDPRFGTLVTKYVVKFDRMTEENGRTLAILSYEGARSRAGAPSTRPGPMGQLWEYVEGAVTGSARFDPAKGTIIDQREQTAGSITIRDPKAAPDAPATARIETRGTRAIVVMTQDERNEQKALHDKKSQELKLEREAKEKAAKEEKPK